MFDHISYIYARLSCEQMRVNRCVPTMCQTHYVSPHTVSARKACLSSFIGKKVDSKRLRKWSPRYLTPLCVQSQHRKNLAQEMAGWCPGCCSPQRPGWVTVKPGPAPLPSALKDSIPKVTSVSRNLGCLSSPALQCWLKMRSRLPWLITN